MGLPKKNSPSVSVDNGRVVENPSKGLGEIVTILLRAGALTKKQIEYAARIRSKLEAPGPLLDVIKGLKYITDDQIKKAIQHNLGSVRIGNLLFELGLISETNLKNALHIQAEKKPKRRLGEILVAHHFIDERKLIEVLSLQMGFPHLDPDIEEIDQQLFNQANARWYAKHDVIPLQRGDHGVIIAFADPLDRNDLEAGNISIENSWKRIKTPSIRKRTRIFSFMGSM